MKRLTVSCGLATKIVVGIYGVFIFLLGTFCVPCNMIGSDAKLEGFAFRPLWYINQSYIYEYYSIDKYISYQFNATLALYLILILTILLFCGLFLIRKNSQKQGSPVS